MPQVSLYIDQELLDAAKRNARFEKVSLSKYVSRALESSANAGWPTGYWELFGSLSDSSFVEPEDIPFNEIAIKANLQ